MPSLVPAKDAKNGEQYSDVVQRLQALVEQLEGGGLSLEDSLEKFAEGIQLVRKGEKLLSEAEKRIEQLLSDDSGTKVVPLELKETGQEPQAQAKRPAAAPAAQPNPQQQQRRGGPPGGSDEDDVPF
ncbi:MAG: exodeoxyribonuclease VII small subunit [Archangiaceae bacterium]|nr:exodeoxyribonuclease VII small subunit [Archangiaceae bacterium]